MRQRSVDYTILKREVDTNRTLYDGLLQQYRQLGVASDAQSNNVSVVDRALLPGEPDSPSLVNNLMIAAALGLAAAAGCIGLIEVLDDTFKTPEDIEERLGLTVVGVIPVYKDPERKRSAIAEVMEDPTSPLAESYRSLRTAVQFSTADGAPKSLLVTSSRPGRGQIDHGGLDCRQFRPARHARAADRRRSQKPVDASCARRRQFLRALQLPFGRRGRPRRRGGGGRAPTGEARQGAGHPCDDLGATAAEPRGIAGGAEAAGALGHRRQFLRHRRRRRTADHGGASPTRCCSAAPSRVRCW